MNDAFEALGDEDRRTLLVALFDEESPDEHVQQSTGVDVGALKSEQRVQTSMYHTHLPKLENGGFIRWDEDTHEVRRGPRFDEIRPLLEVVATHDEG